MKWYAGYNKQTCSYEAFKCASQPTEESHGEKFAFVVGPFVTKRGAFFMQNYGKNNPHCTTVSAIEKIAKLED